MAAGLLDAGDVGCGRGCEFRAQGARAEVLEVIAGDGGGEREAGEDRARILQVITPPTSGLAPSLETAGNSRILKAAVKSPLL